MMKVLGRVIAAIGVTLVLIGASAMDSPSLAAPIVMVFAGLGMLVAGSEIEEKNI